MNSKHPVYIAIEGAIGVGKTTLARLLQSELSADLVLEIFEENPFLADFYDDPERYAFQTQIFFLLSRYRQQQSVREQVGQARMVSDYMFDKDHIFAQLNLEGDELETYQKLYRALNAQVPDPDLVIHLRASVDTLMARIATRDRPYERNMPRDYIASLSNLYDAFFQDYDRTPLIVIDTDDLDVVSRQEDLEEVCGRVRAALEEGAFQPALPSIEEHPADRQARVAPAVASLASHLTRQERERGNPFERYVALQAVLGTVAAMLNEQHETPALRRSLVQSLDHIVGLAHDLGIDIGSVLQERDSQVE